MTKISFCRSVRLGQASAHRPSLPRSLSLLETDTEAYLGYAVTRDRRRLAERLPDPSFYRLARDVWVDYRVTIGFC